MIVVTTARFANPTIIPRGPDARPDNKSVALGIRSWDLVAFFPKFLTIGPTPQGWDANLHL